MVQSAALRESTWPASSSTNSTHADGERGLNTLSARQLTLLSPHTKGLASLADGTLEYMLLRRLSGTDDQGPWPLNETTPLDAPIGLRLDAADVAEARRICSALLLEHPPVLLYGASGAPTPKMPTGSPLNLTALPAVVHVLSLAKRTPSVTSDTTRARGSGAGGGVADTTAMNSTEIVVRLQNVDVSPGSSNVRVDVAALVAAAYDCVEMTISLQQALADNKRMQWRAEEEVARPMEQRVGWQVPAEPMAADGLAVCRNITLAPLDIRTFVLRV